MLKMKLGSFAIVLILVLNLITVPNIALAGTIDNGYISRQLVVDGNKLVYADDPSTMVVLRGVNVPSMGWGMAEHLYESLVETYDSWNANLIRLPIQPKYWFNGSIAEGKNLTAEQYRQYVDEMIKGAAARGKYIILDCHTYVIPTQDVLDMWMDIIPLYGNNPAVLFGLINEPHDIKGMLDPVTGTDDSARSEWDLWRNGGYVSMNSEAVKGIGHQQLVEAIRDAGAKNILVAGGLGWAYNISGIANGYALVDQGTNNNPENAGYGIMYDSHAYPSKGDMDSWDKTIGPVRQIAPVLIGEYGWDSTDTFVTGNSASMHSLWMPQLINWMEDTDNKYGGVPLNWTAWNLHPKSTPRMITGWNFGTTSFNGSYVRDKLLESPSARPLDGEYSSNFEPDTFRGYSNSNITTTVENGSLTLSYKKAEETTACFSRMLLPIDWTLAGLQTLKLDIKGTPNSVINVGFEGTDEEVWTKQITIADSNFNSIEIPINELVKQGNTKTDGLLTPAIRSVYISVDSVATDSLYIDNVKITKSSNPTIKATPYPYILNNPNHTYDMETPETNFASIKDYKGPASTSTFTTTVEETQWIDESTTHALKTVFNRIDGLWGGSSTLNFPVSVSARDAKYFSICYKGTGTAQRIDLKLGSSSDQIFIEDGDTQWRQKIIKLEDIDVSADTLTSVVLNSGTKTADTFWTDNIQFSDTYPEIIAPAKDTLNDYGFERLLFYKYIPEFSSIQGSEGDSISGNIVEEGYKSPRGYHINYVRGSGETPSFAKIGYTKDFFYGHTDWNLGLTTDFVFDARSTSGKPEQISIAFIDPVYNTYSTSVTYTLTNEWQRFDTKINDFILAGSGMLPQRIKGLIISSNTPNTSGSFLIDNISFTNMKNMPEPIPNQVTYQNNFDNDVFAQNGAQWNATITNDYPKFSVQDGVGYQGSKGLVCETIASSSIYTENFIPQDWDFSKVRYVSLKVKSGDPLPYKASSQNLFKMKVELYNSTAALQTGSATFDISANQWSYIVVPLELPGKSYTDEIFRGTNKLTVTIYQKGKFIIDDLTFSDMRPQETVTPGGPVKYLESFDTASMTFSEGYYLSENEYVIKSEKNKGKAEYGIDFQYNLPENPQATSDVKPYIESDLPLSWNLSAMSHINFDAYPMGLNTSGNSNGLWFTTYRTNTLGAFPNPWPNTNFSPVFALVDDLGREYKTSVPMNDSTKWNTFAIPLSSFTNDMGIELDKSKLTKIRIYPDPQKNVGGFWLDNLGFTALNLSVSSITAVNNGVSMIENGLISGNATITANLDNPGGISKKVTLITTLFNKSNSAMYSTKITTKELTTDLTGNISADIEIPTQPQDYILKVLVWDGNISSLSPFPQNSGILEIK